jgi:hypothetical protein
MLANWWIHCLEHHSIWQNGRQEDRLPYNAASLLEAGILPSLFELLCQSWVAEYRGEDNLKAVKEAMLLIEREVGFVITDVKRAPCGASIQDEVKIKVEDTSEDFSLPTLHFDDTLSELSELSDSEVEHDDLVNDIFAAPIAVDEGAPHTPPSESVSVAEPVHSGPLLGATRHTTPEKEASADATLKTITSNPSGLADEATRMDVDGDEDVQSSLTSSESTPSNLETPTTAPSTISCDGESAVESPGAYDGGQTENPTVSRKTVGLIAEDTHHRPSPPRVEEFFHEGSLQGAFEPSMEPEVDPSSQPIADVEPSSIASESPRSHSRSAIVESTHRPQAVSASPKETSKYGVSHHFSIPNGIIVRPAIPRLLSSQMDPAASSFRSPKRQKKQSGPPGGSKSSKNSDKPAAPGEDPAATVVRDAEAPKVRNGIPAEPSKERLPPCGTSAKRDAPASLREKGAGTKGSNG